MSKTSPDFPLGSDLAPKTPMSLETGKINFTQEMSKVRVPWVADFDNCIRIFIQLQLDPKT